MTVRKSSSRILKKDCVNMARKSWRKSHSRNTSSGKKIRVKGSCGKRTSSSGKRTSSSGKRTSSSGKRRSSSGKRRSSSVKRTSSSVKRRSSGSAGRVLKKDCHSPKKWVKKHSRRSSSGKKHSVRGSCRPVAKRSASGSKKRASHGKYKQHLTEEDCARARPKRNWVVPTKVNSKTGKLQRAYCGGRTAKTGRKSSTRASVVVEPEAMGSINDEIGASSIDDVIGSVYYY